MIKIKGLVKIKKDNEILFFFLSLQIQNAAFTPHHCAPHTITHKVALVLLELDEFDKND